jgi:transcriptional regulator NrdR family protein
VSVIGIACPKCGGVEHIVSDSREALGCVRRRRRCAACGHRFTTRETISDVTHASIEAMVASFALSGLERDIRSLIETRLTSAKEQAQDFIQRRVPS